MTIKQDLQSPALPDHVELYQLDLSKLGGETLYFTPHTANGVTSLSFGGQSYMALPVSGSGWEMAIDGAPPQPTLKVSNISRFIRPYLTTFNDLVGAKLTRLQTFTKYLDNGATPNASQVFNTCVYLIEQKTRDTKQEIEFKLSSVIDSPQTRLPKGQVLRTIFPGAGLFRKGQ
ncbi:phage minor tail protein L [Aquabacterium sp.]|uniref:phage minor tail protein L n=1 Tax=Aquabacterium sp. TaxID=1872578 RepID=UPI003D6CF0C4